MVPLCAGRRGNPVLWGRAHFADIAELTGDTGARGLLERSVPDVQAVELDDAIFVDVDTPEALSALGQLVR